MGHGCTWGWGGTPGGGGRHRRRLALPTHQTLLPDPHPARPTGTTDPIMGPTSESGKQSWERRAHTSWNHYERLFKERQPGAAVKNILEALAREVEGPWGQTLAALLCGSGKASEALLCGLASAPGEPQGLPCGSAVSGARAWGGLCRGCSVQRRLTGQSDTTQTLRQVRHTRL